MKADVFIKYKIVFADYDKQISSEMVVFFLFQKKETSIKVNSYICKFFIFKMF